MHLVNNPLYKRSLEESDPALWLPNDVETLVVLAPASYVSPRGRVPAFTDRRPTERILQKLQIMNCQTHSEDDIFSKIFDLIECIMRCVGSDRQLSIRNSGSDELVVNGKRFSIPFSLGCSVKGIPIFHLTNSFARYEERCQLIPDLEHIPQDEDSTDGFDVAALIAQAWNRKEWSAGPDGIYKAHVMYPTSTYKKLVLLTGWVPYTTVTALREGREMLEPITLSREVIDIPSNPDCDWKEIDFFQIIAGLIDEGAKLIAIEPQE